MYDKIHYKLKKKKEGKKKSRYEYGCEGRLKLEVPNGGEREVCFSRGLLAISGDVFSYCNQRCSTGI